VGHICPEATEGGPLAIVENGDRISIDVPNRRVDLLVSEEEIALRFKAWQGPIVRVKKGYLALYANLVKPAFRGAIRKYE